VRIGQGRENSKKYLKENPEIAAKIEKIIRDNAAGISEALMVGPSADDDTDDM
jgi:recombination protein RecA